MELVGLVKASPATSVVVFVCSRICLEHVRARSQSAEQQQGCPRGVPGAPRGDASAPLTPSPASAGVRERFVVDAAFPGETGMLPGRGRDVRLSLGVAKRVVNLV